LIQHSVANLPPIPICFNNPSLEVDPAAVTWDVESRHLEEQLTAAIPLFETHAFDLSSRPGWAQHTKIALRVELWRNLLASGEGAGLVTDRSAAVVQRDAIDRCE
jgi:hypothetical protein